MTDAAKIADAYIALWNETDPQRRRALIGEAWAEDARYVDPIMSGEGRDQIDGLIAAVHERFPGFRFALIGQPDGHGDHVRFSWGLGPWVRKARSRAPISRWSPAASCAL